MTYDKMCVCVLWIVKGDNPHKMFEVKGCCLNFSATIGSDNSL